ncbi:hypothetical protein AB4Z50_17510 [Paenibacillus sp. 2TAB26]|uniref:hypothetical protein n=1 Tax=Paenibacillus sp. 2TAB26 TaxID=3233005 RepID=UPI003F960AF2
MQRELLYVIEFTIGQEKITEVDLISILSRTAANLNGQKQFAPLYCQQHISFPKLSWR